MLVRFLEEFCENELCWPKLCAQKNFKKISSDKGSLSNLLRLLWRIICSQHTKYCVLNMWNIAKLATWPFLFYTQFPLELLIPSLDIWVAGNQISSFFAPFSCLREAKIVIQVHFLFRDGFFLLLLNNYCCFFQSYVLWGKYYNNHILSNIDWWKRT